MAGNLSHPVGPGLLVTSEFQHHVCTLALQKLFLFGAPRGVTIHLRFFSVSRVQP
jgi:hypothetical protein